MTIKLNGSHPVKVVLIRLVFETWAIVARLQVDPGATTSKWIDAWWGRSHTCQPTTSAYPSTTWRCPPSATPAQTRKHMATTTPEAPEVLVTTTTKTRSNHSAFESLLLDVGSWDTLYFSVVLRLHLAQRFPLALHLLPTHTTHTTLATLMNSFVDCQRSERNEPVATSRSSRLSVVNRRFCAKRQDSATALVRNQPSALKIIKNLVF